MPRPRLLFIYLQPTSFVRDDLSLLSRHYDVQAFHFDSNRFGSPLGKVWGLVYHFAALAFWLIREAPRAGLIYSWLVDYHLLLPVLAAKLWRKPVAVALGGAESNWIPEIGYGVFHSRWRAPIARYVFRNVDLLLPVTEALIYSENRYSTWPEVRANGVRAHVPDLQTPYRVIPTGYDAEAWPPGGDLRAATVCTVAHVGTERTLRLKGIDLLMAAARQMPDVAFEIVGVSETMERTIKERFDPSPNVRLLPPRPREELAAIYAAASVYAQLSLSEGLPNALCEAMLCGCIPVGSAVAGIPDAMGDTGVLVSRADPDDVVAAIGQALALGPAYRLRARQRIVDHFSTGRRADALLDALAHLQRT